MSGEAHEVHGVAVAPMNDMNSADYDALVVITGEGITPPHALQDFVASALQLDAGLNKCVAVLRCPLVSGARLVLSPTGPLTPYDDVRSVEEAARAGVRRAVAAGATRPALALRPHARWRRADLVALLAALEAFYEPLQIRESWPQRAHSVRAFGVYAEGIPTPLDVLLRDAVALEIARGLCRDIGGADPERMAPEGFARAVHEAFAGSAVRVREVSDEETLKREYPLLAAVDRGARAVPHHRARVLHLEYVPDTYDATLLLVGKGVTYDTGGCDIKAGGAMAGMSRDKCGAAAIVGFLKACVLLRPALKVVAALGVVRNSVGSRAYVADELLRSRRGVPVRVGNTDAEGRMVMADLLAEMHDRAESEKNPHVYTVATLTGHAHRAYGDGYTAALDNHAAPAHAEKLRAAGELLGDMVEVSRVRREDLAAHRGRAHGDALHQADSRPSVATPRGHQAPAAFLLLAAGLDAGPVPFTHLDVAASAGSLPHAPTAAPLLALAALHGLLAV
ncbi:putative aminopeptidase W07G4.4 [Manduca sexta]|uniref:putative aminopeptidase W07G4.4 n=1 Tax=Manduca sexta TaxID=7130 RepID=UPI00188F36DC|nr:putative aminopeptidase W07G4.4 [Manduca sexta]XP_030019583.2 putative aminopeptidase W07G4.4 [Manduca sexta]